MLVDLSDDFDLEELMFNTRLDVAHHHLRANIRYTRQGYMFFRLEKLTYKPPKINLAKFIGY